MFHHRKTKYKFLRKYFLPISACVLLLGAILFWYNIFLKSPEQETKIFLQNSSQEERPLSKDLDKRLKENMDKFSCEAKNEKLVKGVIKKVSESFLVISDQGREYKIYLKPETIYLRVYVEGKQEEEFEINLSALKPMQSVVASILGDEEGNYFSLLVKQIIDKKK